MTTYRRPELSEAERKELMTAFLRIKRLGFQKTLIYLLNAIFENAVLTAEVNQHRLARNIDPLPSYRPRVE